MSAIYGAIDLAGNNISNELPDKFDKGYEDCRIDRNTRLLEGNVYMHCGLQLFYPRAEKERLPIHDREAHLFFTADCVIDNRKRLIGELGLTVDAPDGDIIYAAYKRWGKECVDHLEGLFSFVVYDEAQREIFAAVDQFSQRCLFYHVYDGVFYFSTLFFPLAEAAGHKFEENERWLVDCVSLRGPVMMTEPKETALAGVYKVVSGTYIVAKLDGAGKADIKEKRYYDPYHTIPTDWSITPDESLEMVRNTMREVLEEVLDGQQDVAADLSSGLDSSTVACMSAQILAQRGGKIFSFTSVPLKEAELEKNRFYFYDETEGVKKICNAYANIEPTFVECRDRYYLTEAEQVVNLWELPCKSQHNSIWSDEINRLVSQKGLRIRLNGETGNTKLSAGKSENIAYYYLKKFKFSKAYHMFDNLRDAGFSRKYAFKFFVKEMIDYYKWYFDISMRECYGKNVTLKSVGEKYDLTKRFNKDHMHYYPFDTMDRMRVEMYMLDSNAQIGEVNVKDSLRHGVLQRDPICSVPFVNLCFKLPIYCFAQADCDRRLVRKGMEGIVPEEIRMDIFHRGRQSGDNTYRVAKVWPEVKEKWLQTVYSRDMLRYLDKDKLDEFVARIGTDINEAKPLDVMFISDLYSFGIYLKKLGVFTKN